jgi:TPR repeat protein
MCAEMLCAGWLASALAVAAAQTAGIDAALMAKANAGDAAAQVQVAQAYENGDQVKQSYAQAAAWYRKAADQGNVQAEIQLASCYRDGRGVDRDMEQAAGWYRKAAEQGDVGAQGTLGLLYSIGQGVLRSDVEAYYWLALAAAVKGPDQAKYAANRQSMAARLTAEEFNAIQARVTGWLAAHSRPGLDPVEAP